MRLIITLILTLSWKIYKVENEKCGKPEVGRELWHVFRIVQTIDVTVYRCFYSHTLHKYSDVTEHCIQAFKTNIYIDKWNDNYYVNSASPIIIKSYTAKANIIQNEITLKSGTTCRYDRGFCYDPKESIDYAVVWEVIDKVIEITDNNLEQIFYGWVDTWMLKDSSLKYLVFQDTKTDRSFALQLARKDDINRKNFWYTDKYGIIASQESLKSSIRSTPHLNQKYLNLHPKQYVSEYILKTCDLQNFPLDFERKINPNYLSDLYNLKLILALLQEQIINAKLSPAPAVTGYVDNTALKQEISDLKKGLRDVQALLFVKDKEVSDLQKNFTSIKDTILEENQGITKTEEAIRNIVSHQESQKIEFDNLKNSYTTLQNKIFNLEKNYDKQTLKDITDIKRDLSELRNKLLLNDEDIYAQLNNTNKKIEGVANNLYSIHSQLKDEDEGLRKEQDRLTSRLNNLELDLNKQTKSIVKCQNDTKILIAEQEKYFLDENKKLEEKYDEIVAKLKSHDDQIGEYQNYTDTLLSTRNTLLDEVQNNIKNLQSAVSRNEIKIGDLQDEISNITKGDSDTDKKIEQLKVTFKLENEEIIAKLSVNKNEIKEIRDKGDLYENAFKNLLFEAKKKFEIYQTNFTSIRDTLSKQEKEIMTFQKDRKECCSKFALIEKKCTEEINNLKSYTDSKLKSKNGETEELRKMLSERDKEIKALYASIGELQRKNIDFVDEINKAQEKTTAKLKEKDTMIKDIENGCRKTEEYFKKELKERDDKYNSIMKEILEIKENMGMVEPV